MTSAGGSIVETTIRVSATATSQAVTELLDVARTQGSRYRSSKLARPAFPNSNRSSF
ncbi:hypothetical protein VB773_06475 [Haloarculaceae archaeon H-GB2-1]|nr:hypothetical protein [Haloarculaceae archaeon H-GB11]MEA5407251.1 hypothetical protein [Haloarculaceae archaeon H-GB2-1]